MEIWQLARQFAKDIYKLVETDPFKFEFGLKQQMKNASGSIMDNIAEGFGRGSKHEFVNHLTIAKGSAEEVRSQCFRCLDWGFIDKDTHQILFDLIEVLVKKIAALIHYLNNVPIKGQKFKDRI